jgi:hypothetical protein
MRFYWYQQDMHGQNFDNLNLNNSYIVETDLSEVSAVCSKWKHSSLFWNDFRNADLSGADFSFTHLHGNLWTGATYTKNAAGMKDTKFPVGFHPEAAGMVAVPELSTALLLGLGMIFLAAFVARRKRNRKG